MLDPLTAFSLAGTVVQFVDFSCKIFSTTQELSQSKNGTSEEFYTHEVITRNLLNLSEKLEANLQENFVDGVLYGGSDQALKKLCEGCRSLSKTMLKRLGKVKIQDRSGSRTMLKQAIKIMWSRKEIAQIATQLAAYQRQLETHVLVAFKEKFDLVVLREHPHCSDHISQKIITTLLQNQSVFDSAINAQTLEITTLHVDTQNIVINEHERTRRVLLAAVENMGSTNCKPSNARNIYQSPELVQQAQGRILRSLQYPSVSERYDQIPKAHSSTFEWIFKDSNEGDRPWSNFKDWLQSGNTIYWINGKAGSGKSTLMKYLYGHSRTRELLKPWSGPLALHVAAFFFWSSGTSEQKSLVGLLRALLYELLSKHKDNISTVLPEQWEDEYAGSEDETWDHHWTLEKLIPAFHNFRSLTGLKICLFVDGLDEYECPDESHDDIASFFVDLAESSGIKICLSSRPWLVFERAFHSFPRLRLQDLTSNDIAQYVHDKVADHERMKELRSFDSEDAGQLVREIVAKASGVFLWVTLVVKSLLNGFANRDRMHDLLKRVRAFPTDLEGFYKHMLLNHIPRIYRDQASQIFQFICICKIEGDGFKTLELPLLILWLAEERDNLPEARTVQILLSLNEKKVLYKAEEIAARLKSRCAGLLEILESSESPQADVVLAPRIAKHETQDWTIIDTFEAVVERFPGFDRGATVTFLHRTVKDFLDRSDIQSLLKSWQGENFNPTDCLLRAYILSLKVATLSEDNDFGPISRRARDALVIAHRARNSPYGLNNQLLDELDKSVTDHWLRIPVSDSETGRSKGQNWADWVNKEGYRRTEKDHVDFLGLAISHGLIEFVAASINEDSRQIQRKKGRPYLDYVFHYQHDIQDQLNMVSLLLKAGADPNKMFRTRTFWRNLLEYMDEDETKPGVICLTAGPRRFYARSSKCKVYEPWLSTLKLLIETGADPNVVCLYRGHYIKAEGGLRKYTIYAFTALHLFSASGLLPDTDLGNMLKLRGAVDLWEIRRFQTSDSQNMKNETKKFLSEMEAKVQVLARATSRKRPWRQRLFKFRFLKQTYA
ncbi:hypothetical protein BKA64DRAFT_37798 [Cadophora sp. MPI-SDFR-AT-0126]|nr:hypothetical protein BKA64DRAFT_37798 [Leotiomycetes sp. MPI-SDFR-AT-0126]